ncbi:YggS family pyridoxal phosphate-dependent enzyme [Mesonia sp. K7]|uniref:YggS family pyridoxal phosphate-dependent enzyme n=1 Tax=Mesonia sp. K7 TaxID=2218606 RepID=UPI000DA79DB1|nr:YggS family pyridoxal phosphate-dependent enzyme [Mesonia sp. K7]PZD79552.1 YggS family pyridoxal phosphate-dependent enzyme [Mesonia sp. K7]
MSSITENILQLKKEIPEHISLIAVSKTKPNEDILEAYQTGHRIFGENKIQEMVDKHEQLPKDIEWHMIGHVQRNKVKYMAPFVHLIHAVDSLKLLKEVNKRAAQNKRSINCLLQVKIAEEDSKFGLDIDSAKEILISKAYAEMDNVKIIGLMGMATFTEDENQIEQEFAYLQKHFKALQKEYPQLQTLSMGMSGDYQIAIRNGSNMIRVGSSIFGERNYH